MCILYVHVAMCIYAWGGVHAHVGVHSWRPEADFKYLLQVRSALFSKTGSLVEFKVHQLARLTGHGPRDVSVSCSPVLGSHWGSYVDVGDPNSVPHACTADTFQTQPPLQTPFLDILSENNNYFKLELVVSLKIYINLMNMNLC